VAWVARRQSLPGENLRVEQRLERAVPCARIGRSRSPIAIVDGVVGCIWG
jgi:hypothetical protein